MVPGHVTNRQTKMKRKNNALHIFVGFFFNDHTNMQEKNHATQPLTSIPKIQGQCTKFYRIDSGCRAN